jgi:hypothetical protein
MNIPENPLFRSSCRTNEHVIKEIKTKGDETDEKSSDMHMLSDAPFCEMVITYV